MKTRRNYLMCFILGVLVSQFVAESWSRLTYIQASSSFPEPESRRSVLPWLAFITG